MTSNYNWYEACLHVYIYHSWNMLPHWFTLCAPIVSQATFVFWYVRGMTEANGPGVVVSCVTDLF